MVVAKQPAFHQIPARDTLSPSKCGECNTVTWRALSWRAMLEPDNIRLTVLRRCDLFKGADESTLQDAVRRGIAGSLTKNQILFRAGDPSVHITLVLRGRLRLTQIGSQGDEIVVRYIGPGELTALVSLFRESPYPVTANAVEATGILQWTRDAMEGLFTDCPRLAMNAMFMMVRTDRRAAGQVSRAGHRACRATGRPSTASSRRSGRQEDRGGSPHRSAALASGPGGHDRHHTVLGQPGDL